MHLNHFLVLRNLCPPISGRFDAIPTGNFLASRNWKDLMDLLVWGKGPIGSSDDICIPSLKLTARFTPQTRPKSKRKDVSQTVFGGVSVSWFRSSESQTSGLEGASNGTTLCKCLAVWWKTDPPKIAENNLSIYHISMDLADIHAVTYVSRNIFCTISTSIDINPRHFLMQAKSLATTNFAAIFFRWNWKARIIIHSANVWCIFIQIHVHDIHIIELYAGPKQYVKQIYVIMIHMNNQHGKGPPLVTKQPSPARACP